MTSNWILKAAAEPSIEVGLWSLCVVDSAADADDVDETDKDDGVDDIDGL